MILWTKYGVSTSFSFPMVKRGVVDLAATADWTPATGDTKVSKDGGNVANTSNNPAAVGGTGSVSWTLTLTATELQAAVIDVQVVDAATKAVEDQYLKIYTYGHASARIQVDWSDAVRLGLTALPNVAAGANNGLPLGDASARVLLQPTQTGVTIPTVTTLTNLPAITANWLTAAGIASGALNGKGDWNIGKTGYALSAAGAQAVWDALTSALTVAGSIGKLLVDNINATILSRLASAGYTAPLDAAGTRSAVGLASANLDTQLTAIPWNPAWDAEVESEVADAMEAMIADSIPADGSRPSIKQALYLLTQFMMERSVSGTTLTVKKPDGTTTLMTLTLDNAINPTSITRTT